MPKPSEFLVDELVKLGLDFCRELMASESELQVRRLFRRRGVAENVSSAYFELPDKPRGLIVFRAHRRLIDEAKLATSSRSATLDPLHDAEQFRRAQYTSQFSHQDIAERSG